MTDFKELLKKNNLGDRFEQFLSDFDMKDSRKAVEQAFAAYASREIDSIEVHSRLKKLSDKARQQSMQLSIALEDFLLDAEPAQPAASEEDVDVAAKIEADKKRIEEIFNELRELISRQKLDDPALEKRMYNIFLSRYRGIRNDLRTHQAVSKPVDRGGLGFSPQKADGVLKEFNRIIAMIEEKEYRPEYLLKRFNEEWESTLTQPEPPQKTEDMPIDVQDNLKEIPHRPVAQGHDMSQPFDRHVMYHQSVLGEHEELEPPTPSTEPRAEVAAPKKQPEVSQAVPEADLDEKMNEVKKKIQGLEKKFARSKKPARAKAPAPTPQDQNVRVATSEQDRQAAIEQLRKEIAATATQQEPIPVPTKKPEMPDGGRSVTDENPVGRRMEIGDSRSATEQQDIGVKEVEVKEKKPGFFSRLFGASKKKKGKKIAPPPSPQATPAKKEQRPRMDDIKYESQLHGPIDELRSLSVADFRRLSSNPEVAIEKLQHKLELLASESYQKRVLGEQALRESELYKAYSGIMSESIMQGVSLQQAIQNQATLSKQEFEAVRMLNKKLSRV